MSGLSYNEDGDSWTTPKPATVQTARYGIRRPRANTWASLVRSQAPILPTDPTRVTSRDGCARGACGQTLASNRILESKESLCGDCYQPVHGPGQPAWVSSYDDSLAELMINSEARDRLILKAYEDLANQSSQVPSRPVLCKALARLYNHTPGNRLRVNPAWDSDDWRTVRWYQKNCYPYMTAAGSTMFYERPLPSKGAVDNILRQLGPMLSSFGCRGLRQTYGEQCPCFPPDGERAVYARKPTQMDIKRFQDGFAQEYRQQAALDQREQMRRMYGLIPEGARGEAILAEQNKIVQDQKALRDMANPDYDKRIYDARVDQHRRQQTANQQRINATMDRTGNALTFGHGS